MTTHVPTALPPGWQEIFETANDSEIQKDLDRLMSTFPKRYLHLSVIRLREKMRHKRTHDDHEVASLRLFRHTNAKGVDDISLFYFLRFKSETPAYCISLGVESVTANEIYDELKLMCGYMQRQHGVKTVDILSHRFDVEADLNDTTNAGYVGAAFKLAEDQLFYCGIFNPKGPWPYELYRWEVGPIGP